MGYFRVIVMFASILLLLLPSLIYGKTTNVAYTEIDEKDYAEWWLLRLVQNLLSYATIIVPGAVIVYFVKRIKHLENIENVCMYKCLHLCIYGSEVEKPNLELGEVRHAQNQRPERSTYHQAFILLFCFFGLQISYLTWGLLQEKIMTQEYQNAEISEKFTDSQFLVFVNRVLAFIFAGIYITFTRQPRHTAPLYKYSYCSFSNVMSSWCQYEALKYVSFPTQVLAKASKIIPVMLMGKVVSKKSYNYHEYITAAMISMGMTMFLLSRGHNHDKGTATSIAGVFILVGYMLFDSFTSNWQGELFNQHHMSSVQMMCGVNLFSCLLTSVSLLQQGGFSKSLLFMLHFSSFFTDCLLLSMCSALGQLFIFYTISQFGPVVFVIMMTIRQAIAILLSCLIYHHSLSWSGIVGVITVFVAVFLRIYLSQKQKSVKQNQKAKPASTGQKV